MTLNTIFRKTKKVVSSKKIGLGIFMFLNVVLIIWLMLTL